MEKTKRWVLDKKKIIFVIIFASLGFLAMQVRVANIVGSRANFTLFDAFAPTAGAFLGSFYGIIAVFLMQIFNFFVRGAIVFDAGIIIRFITPIFATLYFARKGKINLVVPLVAIIAFNLHPVGRSVWFFSLYWLIPVICHFLRSRFLFARTLGTTFTAHAVGGALWIYFFDLPRAVWISLIPVVALERLLFATGLAVTYVLLTNILYFLEKKHLPFINHLHLNRKYIWKRLVKTGT